MPKSNWFALLDRFQKQPPTEVTPLYISQLLGMKPNSGANTISTLKSLGLVGKDNRLTPLAHQWRHDDSYASACSEILEATYPAELRELYPAPASEQNKTNIANWFSRKLNLGTQAAEPMAALYLLILEADATKRESIAKGKEAGSQKQTFKPNNPTKRKAAVTNTPPSPPQNEGPLPEKRGLTPKLHVDIQIHISPDSSPEQIDKIFESMAKHLPLKG